MTIEIRGISIDRALHDHVDKKLASALVRLTVKPVVAQATFFDENGPKGGLAVRCALTVRVPYRAHVRAEDTAETTRLAFDGSLAKLERELERYRERDRDDKRHPKKYYAAKQLTTATPEGAGAAPKRPAASPPARARGRRRV
jgi:ribosomal subunit interface protein